MSKYYNVLVYTYQQFKYLSDDTIHTQQISCYSIIHFLVSYVPTVKFTERHLVRP